MKRILLHTFLAGAAAIPLLLLGTATAASADEPCALLVVCSPPEDGTEPEPEPQPEPQPAPAEASHRSAAEITADLLVLLNKDRAAHGLPAFTRRDDVDGVAAGWSDHLADANALSHNDAYFTSESRQRLGARALGENVAMDYEAQPAHEHLMASPHHRDNILDARFLVVGLGATYRDGKWWITEDFLQPVSTARREIARSSGGPAPTNSSSSGTVARTTAAAPAAPPAAEVLAASEGSSSDSDWLMSAPSRVRSKVGMSLPGTSPEGKVPAGAAGVAVAGLCGVSGLFLRRRRVPAEFAIS